MIPLRDFLKLILPPAAVIWRRRVPDIPGPQSLPPAAPVPAAVQPLVQRHTIRLGLQDSPPFMMLDTERARIVWSMARQCSHLAGDFLEAGVYRGGSALLIWRALQAEGVKRSFHLFDSFAGLPAPGDRDRHAEGDLSDTSVEDVRSLFAETQAGVLHQGWIPETFRDCGVGAVAFAHVDLDLERSVLDACEFIYPRLQHGGIIVFDDYGFPSCPGARAAVDAFFEDLPEVPLVLPTGEAVVFRLSS